MLETTCDYFASDMNGLDASATIYQAKVRALGSINDAFSIGVLIGRSVSDDVVAFDGAIPATKNWEKRCAMVNKTLGYIAYKDGESARVAYLNLKKT
jgi:hypothetical protein